MMSSLLRENHKVSTSGKRTKNKGSNNAFLRRLVCFAIATMVLPLLYVNLNVVRSTEVEMPPTIALKKNLESFQEISSHKIPIDTFYSDSDGQEMTRSIHISSLVDDNRDKNNLVLTAYLEPPETLIETRNSDTPFVRNTSASLLRPVRFPNVNNCTTLMQSFPVDDFPLDDPFLPWIHDYFPSMDKRSVHFVAQNRRKCDTGEDYSQKMKFWTPQVALFQGTPIVVKSTANTQQSTGGTENDKTIYRLASTFQEATHNSTRFQCRFHHGNITVTTLSFFPFDYEFIDWVRGKQGMLAKDGKRDHSSFWLNQLLFSCPIPEVFQPLLSKSSENRMNKKHQPAFYIDIIPIRTPVRSDYLFQSFFHSNATGINGANESLKNVFVKNHVLPPMDDTGRWQNLPVCPRSDNLLALPGRSSRDKLHRLPGTDMRNKEEKPYRLVACTWTSSSYNRRGESVKISDSAERLREWIQFHLMVGFDHIFIYDNTDTSENGNPSSFYDISQSFGTDQVTYHAWPCKICNNNKPFHGNPGVRSSQYAAESSCQTRYGELSEWMTFIDIDEYMVPMKQKDNGEYSWYPVLDEIEEMDISIMKLRSSRAKPRIEFTEHLKDQCTDLDGIVETKSTLPVEPCVGPMKNKTFLQVYNCEYIRPPKPERFDRAMKQIYRPSYVLSHFVHYSTVTIDMRSHIDFIRSHPGTDPKRYYHITRDKESPEIFVDEITQGFLVHARSVLPHETVRRSAECSIGSKHNCLLGYLCGDDVEYIDELQSDNVFFNPDGSFCNCWRNKVVEEVLVPKLENLLSSKF